MSCNARPFLFYFSGRTFRVRNGDESLTCDFRSRVTCMPFAGAVIAGFGNFVTSRGDTCCVQTQARDGIKPRFLHFATRIEQVLKCIGISCTMSSFAHVLREILNTTSNATDTDVTSKICLTMLTLENPIFNK